MMTKRFGYVLLLALLVLTSCERRAWEKTTRTDTLAAYQAYVKDYPNGRHLANARSAIESIRLREVMTSNAVADYEKFLQDFPRTIARDFIISNLMRLLEPKVRALTPDEMDRMTAEIETSLGTIRFRFYALDAPETCRNFIKLAGSHFYDGLPFIRVSPGELIQTGAPREDMTAGPGYTIKAEFNGHLHVPGAVAMHRDRYPDSAGSQFYIGLADLPERDYQYTVFGQVTEGMAVVKKIGELDTNGPDGRPIPYRPLENIYITRIAILEPQGQP